MPFQNFPYMDAHEANADWALQEIKKSNETSQKALDKITNFTENTDMEKYVRDEINKMIDSGRLNALADPYELKGKNIFFFGDSLTWGDSGDSTHSQVTYPFPKIIELNSGCYSWNFAKKSATMAVKENTNNLQNQISGLDNNTIPDMIFIEFGTNDMSKGVAIGNDTTTDWRFFKGALKSAINDLNIKFPETVIVVLGIFPGSRAFTHNYNSWRSPIDTYELALKEVCRETKVRYIDILNMSGMTEEIFNSVSPDGTHFTQEGYNMIALTILRNLGGNSTDISYYENRYNKNTYPSHDVFGETEIIKNGANVNLNSYSSITLSPGLYYIEFEYECECGSYDPQTEYNGIHFKTIDDYIASPIGIVNGKGRIYSFFKITNTISGLFMFRTARTSNVAVDNLKISNIKICNVKGNINLPDVLNPTIESTSGYYSIKRNENGTIDAICNLTINKDVVRYGTIFNSTHLIVRRNENIVKYFPVFVGGVMHRGQLLSNGNVQVDVAITTGQSIQFMLTNF